MIHRPKNLATSAAMALAFALPNSNVVAQGSPTPVAYSVVCDDPNIKLVIEQKVVASIQSSKGYVVDTSGKAEVKIVFAVAPIKRKKDKGEDVVALAIATLGLRGATITYFENRTFSPDGYEDGLAKLVPHVLGSK